MPKARLHVAKSGGWDAALRHPVGAARRPYHYAGNTVERVTSLSMVCFETSSTVAPTLNRREIGEYRFPQRENRRWRMSGQKINLTLA